MRWLVNESERRFQLNLKSYSSIFVNHSSNEQSMVGSIIQYFQPRSKVKDIVNVLDIDNDYEDITSHAYYAHMFSNDLLLQETQLGAKTVLKSTIKHRLGNHMETDGYLLTINTLIEDIMKRTVSDLPLQLKRLNIDSLIKLFNIDLTETDIREKGYTNYYLYQAQRLLEVLVNQLLENHQKPIMLIYNFPESYLSPKEQLEMKKILTELGNSIEVLVVTKSLIFLANDLGGSNYFINENQLITESLLDDLEWNCPVDYEREEIKASLLNLFKQFANYFELKPTISNYQIAEVNLFNSLDLYVLVYVLDQMDFDFVLDLEEEKVAKPVLEYVKYITGEL